ncbi:hypothetical protein MFUL124B02_29095 [Myxococcus fulvus 124B02]|nr:hypothetical protein MFUL124B02_29095 [Myxococcus fulvus 124B02]
MRTLLTLGLAVLGFQFGCGVDDANTEVQPDMASQEAPLLICLSEYLIRYYSDATLTTLVGTERCFCGRTPVRTGQRSPYFIESDGGECPGIAPEARTNEPVTTLEIPPPAATMNCEWMDETERIECTGSASGGVTPYTYQWQRAHNLDVDPAPGNWPWRNGTTTFSEPCKFGLYPGGRYYYKYIRFRVLDANTYVSNYGEQSFRCWTPNP